MPKHDTPAKIAAELRTLLFNPAFQPGYMLGLHNQLQRLVWRLDALKPGPVRGWWAVWRLDFPHDPQWHVIAAYPNKRTAREYVERSPFFCAIRPFDPSDTGPTRPPKGVKR